jgi:hypothetical protein
VRICVWRRYSEYYTNVDSIEYEQLTALWNKP